ncbi:MAG: ADOP family duplicated permease [Bryobacteraceae bacterium]
MIENIVKFLHDLKFAARSLTRAKGLTVTVVLTLALGIGANAAMFSLVRGVLLRPLVNRDEDRLIYIRQSAEGVALDNAWFSVPEIQDLRSRVKSFSEFGDFSIIGFTMVGLGEPREVRAGVVGGSYFQVMGLRPVLGRLLDARDDGPNAAGAVVLTYRFWSTTLKSDPAVLGKTVRLGSFDSRTATVVGVLEPCVPYPADTEIIANIVTSAHHLSATMVTGRIHRMTDLFARLAPGADLETARAELRSVYGTMKQEHPEAYLPVRADFRISAVRLRDQLTSGARTILLVLMAASILVFVIACSNVANLILARTVRREGELGIRAALGASTTALRRTLLAESLLLCVAGASIGVLVASPLVTVLARYASRYSVRALDLTIDPGMLWVGAALAIVAAVLLAFAPRLPSSGGEQGFSLASGSARVTGSANRRLRVFAVIQIAASFVLVASAGATVKTLLSLEAQQTGIDTHHVLAVNVPKMDYHKTPAQVLDFYREATRRIRVLPAVQNVAIGTIVPWRDNFDFELEFSPDGHARPLNGEGPRAAIRIVSPGFFATLGLPIIEGRDFNDADRSDSEPVAIVSQTVAHRIFPTGDALNHHVMWTDPLLKFIPLSPRPQRVVGVVADMDDAHIEPRPTPTVYQPFDQAEFMGGGRMFVHVRSNPYGLVTPITRVLRTMSADQPVEHAATLEDIRAEVLTPDRLNVVVFGVFAAVALLIAVVGVAGVLAFSVSGRTREFGIRLAVGSQPRNLLTRVIAEGAAMAVGGLVVGLVCGYWLAQLAGRYLGDVKTPGFLPVAGSALVLLLAAVIASAVPAARAARVDVMQALRTE